MEKTTGLLSERPQLFDLRGGQTVIKFVAIVNTVGTYIRVDTAWDGNAATVLGL